MKSLVSTVLVTGILFGVCSTVIADTSDTATVEIWKCTLNEGKTMDDVAAANGKWVKFMNANVEGGDIHSYGQTAVVGEQGSFLYIDECLEGTLRFTRSDWTGPVNIGSDEMVTIDQLADMAMEIAGKKLTKKHIEGPLGVRGRNSDNRLIEEKLGWIQFHQH